MWNQRRVNIESISLGVFHLLWCMAEQQQQQQQKGQQKWWTKKKCEGEGRGELKEGNSLENGEGNYQKKKKKREKRREKKEEHNKNISRKMEGKHEKNIRGHVFNRLTWDWQPKQAAKCVSNKATRGIQESRRRENPRYLEAMAKQKNRDTMQRIPISSK